MPFEAFVAIMGAVLGVVSAWGGKWIGSRSANKDSETNHFDTVINQLHNFNDSVQKDRDRVLIERDKYAERNKDLVERNSNLAKENKAIRQKLCECEQRNERLRGGE